MRNKPFSEPSSIVPNSILLTTSFLIIRTAHSVASLVRLAFSLFFLILLTESCLVQFVMSSPIFWSNPLKYCRWAARERPAFFWSVMIGAAGPIAVPIVPPIRKYFGDIDPAPVPVTYPGTSAMVTNRRIERSDTNPRYAIANMNVTVPTGPRKQLSGYDD